MAAEDPAPRTSDDASIALLRSLRAGAVDSRYVHRVDVCSAAPEDLVADLQPVPGKDVAEDGYSSIWYFYCPKKFKNAQGKASGHRQRAIAGGDTCWHAETRPKPVKDLDGATFCNLSYGRKDGSSRSFNRLGWCMTEYDDKEGGGGDDHVLCKIHRSSSSLARGKLKSSSSSTRPALSKQTALSTSGSKRKTTSDHPETRPNKISHTQACANQEFYFVDHQVQEPLPTEEQITMPVDYESLFPGEEEQVQQNTLFTMSELLGSPGDEYVVCSPNNLFTMDDLFSRSSGCCSTPTAMAPPDAAFFEGLAF